MTETCDIHTRALELGKLLIKAKFRLFITKNDLEDEEKAKYHPFKDLICDLEYEVDKISKEIKEYSNELDRLALRNSLLPKEKQLEQYGFNKITL